MIELIVKSNLMTNKILIAAVAVVKIVMPIMIILGQYLMFSAHIRRKN